jgi:hypothetical protein
MTKNRSPQFISPYHHPLYRFNALFITGKDGLEISCDTDVLIIGNTILFVATLISFFLYKRALKDDQPHKF